MPRKTSRDIIKRILDSVRNGPKSIYEIAQDVGSNWGSICKYLESLRDARVLIETSVNNTRSFGLIVNNIQPNGNFFDLPINSDTVKTIDSIYNKIVEEWKKQTGVLPGRVQVHKSLYKINKDCAINLPMGWYLFGALCVKPYNPATTYDYSGLDRKILTCVKDVVTDYSKEKSTYTLKIKQYTEENKILYLTKEALSLLFSSNRFDKNNIQEISKMLYTFLANLPKIHDKESLQLVNEFVGTVLQLINSLPDEELASLKPDIMRAFSELWEMIALYQFSNDLESHYSKEILFKHMNIERNLRKCEVEEQLLYLNDFIPKKVISGEDNYSKIRKIISEATTNETKQKRKDELEKTEKEIGLEEMQKKLFAKQKI